MRSIGISEGDLNISSKRMQMVEDLEQKKQKTRQILYTVLGELFYNGDVGLGYSDILEVNEKNIPIERKKLAILKALANDDNIEKVADIVIVSDSSSRKQTITLKLKYKEVDTMTTIGGVTVG